jgi:predicted ester cyclase
MEWRWVVRGTNSGPLDGQPPTGRAITIEGCEIIEVKDGQIHAVRGYFDRLSISIQLGRFPNTPAGD